MNTGVKRLLISINLIGYAGFVLFILNIDRLDSFSLFMDIVVGGLLLSLAYWTVIGLAVWVIKGFRKDGCFRDE